MSRVRRESRKEIRGGGWKCRILMWLNLGEIRIFLVPGDICTGELCSS